MDWGALANNQPSIELNGNPSFAGCRIMGVELILEGYLLTFGFSRYVDSSDCL